MLIAIITYDKEQYALSSLLESLKNQTLQDFDLLFVDNSEQDDYKQELQKQLQEHFPGRFTILKASGTDRFSKILNSRKKVREHFLQTTHQDILMFDSDILLPPNAVELFKKYDKPLATAICLIAVVDDADKQDIRPCIYLDVPGGAIQPSILKTLQHEKLDIGAAGLGCTYAKRVVLEQIDFRLNKRGRAEDITFYRDAIAKGFKPVALCHIRCVHMHYAKGDPRNKRFDASKYKLSK